MPEKAQAFMNSGVIDKTFAIVWQKNKKYEKLVVKLTSNYGLYRGT